MFTKTLATLAVALATAGAFTPAHAAFTGDFGAAHWSTSNSNGGNGSAVVAADGSTLTLTSSDFPSFSSLIDSTLSFAIVLTHDTTISFQWNYLSNDENGSSADPFGYSLGGSTVQLSQDGSYDPQTGTVTLNGHAGQTFAFYERSLDSIFGASSATISGFTAISAVPEPGTSGMLLAGLAAMAGVARRRRAR